MEEVYTLEGGENVLEELGCYTKPESLVNKISKYSGLYHLFQNSGNVFGRHTESTVMTEFLTPNATEEE